jgi:5'-3' exonuclease
VPSTIHLIDASVYVFRAYFSGPSDFVDHEQHPVQAVYGFLGFLLSLLEQSRPTHLLVAFDESLTTSFRNQFYPEYKANREVPPPDIDRQFSYCRELVTAMGMPSLRHKEYEADDLIGSVLLRMRPLGFRGVIVSADKDLSQLIGDDDRIWDFAKNQRYGPDGVVERMGVRPDQVVDFLALTGDAVDNIPGVPGVGPKTASALLAHFGTLDAVLARVEEIPFLRLRGAAATAAKIKANRELALLSRRLTAIALDAPVPDGPDAFALSAPDAKAMDALLDRLRFGPMTRRRVREYSERFGRT